MQPSSIPPAKEGWLHEEGHDLMKVWRRRWVVIENGLMQIYESERATLTNPPIGLVPLNGASLRDPKSERGRRPSVGGASTGPAFRIDTAAKEKDTFYRKCARPSEPRRPGGAAHRGVVRVRPRAGTFSRAPTTPLRATGVPPRPRTSLTRPTLCPSL
jgi:hypothetical protein